MISPCHDIATESGGGPPSSSGPETRSDRPGKRLGERIGFRVWVAATDGELLFSGLTANKPWHTAFGDYVYALETSPRTEERIAVRYRLVEPFD